MAKEDILRALTGLLQGGNVGVQTFNQLEQQKRVNAQKQAAINASILRTAQSGRQAEAAQRDRAAAAAATAEFRQSQLNKPILGTPGSALLNRKTGKFGAQLPFRPKPIIPGQGERDPVTGEVTVPLAKPTPPLSKTQVIGGLLTKMAEGTITDDEKEALKAASPKGMTIKTDKQGNTIVTFGGTGIQDITGAPTPATKTKIQKNILDGQSRLNQLSEIDEMFRDDFLNVVGSTVGTITNAADFFKLADVLPDSFTQFLSDQKKFKTASQRAALEWRKWVTGVATNPTEVVDIAKSFPNAELDNPIAFKAKLDYVKSLTSRLLARMQKNGVLKLTPEQIIEESKRDFNPETVIGRDSKGRSQPISTTAPRDTGTSSLEELKAERQRRRKGRK